jgi:hypothetical protein
MALPIKIVGQTPVQAPSLPPTTYSIPVTQKMEIDPDSVTTVNGITTADVVVQRINMTQEQLQANVNAAQAKLDAVNILAAPASI